MHCRACDKELTEYESRKTDIHGEHTDLCSRCLSISIATTLDIEIPSEDVFDDVVNITEDDLLTYQENYDKILLSITNV